MNSARVQADSTVEYLFGGFDRLRNSDLTAASVSFVVMSPKIFRHMEKLVPLVFEESIKAV